MILRPPSSTPFPTRRSSDLQRLDRHIEGALGGALECCGLLQDRPQIPVHPHPLPASAAVQEQAAARSEEHTSELQSPDHLVCRLLLEKKKNKPQLHNTAHSQ